MDKAEAGELLAQHIAALRATPYQELRDRVAQGARRTRWREQGVGDIEEVVGPSGDRYTVARHMAWADKGKTSVVVMLSVHGRGRSWFTPEVARLTIQEDGTVEEGPGRLRAWGTSP